MRLASDGRRRIVVIPFPNISGPLGPKESGMKKAFEAPKLIVQATLTDLTLGCPVVSGQQPACDPGY